MTPLFLTIFGVMLIISPIIDILSNYGADEDAVIRWAINKPMQQLLLAQAMTFSGFIFFAGGIALMST